MTQQTLKTPQQSQPVFPRPQAFKPLAGVGLGTKALHVGSEHQTSASGSVIPAIEMSTTYAQHSAGVHTGFEYSRSSNPTRLALERLLASIECADVLLEENLAAAGIDESFDSGPAAMAMASGSAATATVVSALAGRGGHIVSVSDVYGGTARYMTKAANMQQGVETTFVDMSYRDTEDTSATDEELDAAVVARIEAAIRPDTKIIWAETPTNPLLSLVPIGLVATVAQRRGIPFVVDNTFASPYYQNPLLLGADVVVHSITKYLNGHSDVVMGAIVTANPQLLAQFRFMQNAHGAVPSVFDSWLVIRGIKTLQLRARQHGLNALNLALWLDRVAVPAGLVRDVRYPGLRRVKESPAERKERHLAWDQLSDGAKKWATKLGYSRDGEDGFPAGGMISFHIASDAPQSQEDSTAADRFLTSLQIFTLAESLGGVESLAELPVKMTHAGIAIERRRELGIDCELIRLSVGVEDEEDIIQDVKQALGAALGKAAL